MCEILRHLLAAPTEGVGKFEAGAGISKNFPWSLTGEGYPGQAHKAGNILERVAEIPISRGKVGIGIAAA